MLCRVESTLLILNEVQDVSRLQMSSSLLLEFWKAKGTRKCQRSRGNEISSLKVCLSAGCYNKNTIDYF